MLLMDSDTDVEEEGPNPDVAPPKHLKITPNVPETPDVGLKIPNPDVPWLKNGCGMLQVESDTDVEEEEEIDLDVELPKRLKMTQNVPETPDVVAKTPNPDVSGPKMRCRMQVVGSDTVVEEDPYVQPQKRLRVTQNMPGIPDVEVETPNPAVGMPKTGHWTMLVDSNTDVEGEEENPDVQPPKQLRMTQNVPETPDVAASAPNLDVSGPKLHSCMLLVDSDTDVEDEVNPDMQPPKRLRRTQNVSRIPGVEVETPNPAVERPKIGHHTLVVDSDTDVEEDADMQPPKRLRMTQNVPETPDVQWGTPNPDVSGPTIGYQMLVDSSDTDVEEDPYVETLKKLEMTQNVPESPDVVTQTPNPDAGVTKNGCQALLMESDTDVEEEEGNPDVCPSKRWENLQNMLQTPDVPTQPPNPAVEASQRRRALLDDSDTDVEEEEKPDVGSLQRLKPAPNVPETPDVRLKMPNPDVSGTKIGCGTLLVDSETDVEEDETGPDVRPLKRRKMTPNVPESPDVLTPSPNPAVGGTESRCVALVMESDTDVEEDEACPDVWPSKRQKITQNVPETPDVGRHQRTQNVAETPDVEDEEEGWDPDVATQLFLPSNPDGEEAEVDPDVGSPKQLQITQKPHEIPDVEKGEESDPDVATQLFLPSPDVGTPESPKMAPKDPKIPDVEGLPSLEPDVATQLFLPPHPGVGVGPNPDVLGPKQHKMASNYPKISDVRAENPDPDVEGEEDLNVATQLFLPPDPDVEGEGPSGPDIGSSKPLKSPLNPPEVPDVDMDSPNPDVEASLRGHRKLLGDADPGVEEADPNPDVAASRRPQMAPKVPRIADVEADTPSPDVEELGSPDLDPDVATQLFLPSNPVVGCLESPKMALEESQIPDVEQEPPNPDVGDPPSPTQEEAEAPPTLQVLFTGLVASPALRVALGTLGGTEATSVHDCSHLVTDGIRRTLKFLCALGRGVPIVTPQWLLESSHIGRPLSPGPFLPRDPPCERRFGFRLRPALARARERPLLQGYQVHVTPSVQPCPEDMRDIVTCCGGTFLPQLPREHAPRVLVISCPQDRGLWPPAVAARLPLLSAELLLSGVLQQRLELAPFLLSPWQPPETPPNPTPNQKHPTQKPPNSAQKQKNPSQKTPNPPPDTPNPTQRSKNPPQKPPNPTQNAPNPPQKTPNPFQKQKNLPRKRPNPTQSTSPQTHAWPHFGGSSPPPSPPRTRSGRRTPQNPPPKAPNSGTLQKTPNPPQKTPKRPQGHSEVPDPDFGIPGPPPDPPRTRSHRGPPQNPPWDPPSSGTPKETPKRSPKNPNPPKKTPKHLQSLSGGSNPNAGVPDPPLDPPQEPPRTRSGRRHPPDPGNTPKTPNRPQNAPHSTQNQKKPTQNPPNPSQELKNPSPKTPNPPSKTPNPTEKSKNPPQKHPNSTQNPPNSSPKRPRSSPEGSLPSFGVAEPPPSPPRTRSRRGIPIK
uniref:BRCT domain-containing protein n=1 Tax=Taeniopygia guttata TaxID=59729 RepID=A0A674HP18_TAEGU